MSPLKASLATALTMAAACAQADANFYFNLSAENIEKQLFKYTSGPSDGFSSQGLQSIGADGVGASVNAWADPRQGVFKSFNSAFTPAGQNVNIASSSATMYLTDTLRLSGPGATARVDLQLNWDSAFSGMGFAAFNRVGEIEHSLMASSSRTLSLSYLKPNPIYDPKATCIDYGGDGMYCPPETQEFITQTESLDKALRGSVTLTRPDNVVTAAGTGNGRHTGQQILSLDLPTGIDIQLRYSVSNNVECFHLAQCDVRLDASHSDYLGISLAQGNSFSSTEGYQYLGLAAAVPEPSTLMLGLIGVMGMALRARRNA